MINFITLKWGTKYGPEYVNRLHNSLKIHYKKPFKFMCITDDYRGLNCEIYPLLYLVSEERKVFTAEKMEVFGRFKYGKFCLLDLDILITGDLTQYFDEYDFCEPRIILNRWQDHSRVHNSYFVGDCFINSSFVTWKDDQLQWLYKLFTDNLDIIEYKYKSLDKFIFYSSFDKLNFHPENVVYAYSFGAKFPDDLEEHKYRPDYKIALFHTSHKEGVELHDAEGWAKEMWCGYDSI
jgi:hypothetical protein